jgi:hypothetical protein
MDEKYSIHNEIKEFIEGKMISAYTVEMDHVHITTLEGHCIIIDWEPSHITIVSVNGAADGSDYECLEQVLSKYSPLYSEAHNKLIYDKLLKLQ